MSPGHNGPHDQSCISLLACIAPSMGFNNAALAKLGSIHNYRECELCVNTEKRSFASSTHGNVVETSIVSNFGYSPCRSNNSERHVHELPLISFVYDGDRPPLRKIPCGKSELLSISLYQTVINGLVLTVNDANQKCVGVAVWTGPVRRGFFGRIGGWCILAILYLWLFINMFYYGLRGNRMNKKVNPSCYICQL
jgi:hypothetical protein